MRRHAPEAAWSQEQADATQAYLLAALEHLARHRSLRYCKVSLIAQGVGASASLQALSRYPSAFEQRLKALVVCDPAPPEADSVGEAEALVGEVTAAVHAQVDKIWHAQAPGPGRRGAPRFGGSRGRSGRRSAGRARSRQDLARRVRT